MVQIDGRRRCQHGCTVVCICICAGTHTPCVVIVDIHPWHLAFLGVLSRCLIDLEDGVICACHLDGLTGRTCMVVVNSWHIFVVQVILHCRGICTLRQLSALLDSTLIEYARHGELL